MYLNRKLSVKMQSTRPPSCWKLGNALCFLEKIPNRTVEKSPYLHHSKQKNTKLIFTQHQAGKTKYFSLFYLISVSKSVTTTNLDDRSPTRFTHQPLWLCFGLHFCCSPKKCCCAPQQAATIHLMCVCLRGNCFSLLQQILGSRGLSHLARALGRSLLTSLGELALFTDFNCNQHIWTTQFFLLHLSCFPCCPSVLPTVFPCATPGSLQSLAGWDFE